MPTSHYSQLNQIMSIIFHVKPKSILDIGVGFGKFGVLCREYLEMWRKNRAYHKKDWKTRIDGIEIFDSYKNPLYDFVYNTIYFDNALNVLPKLKCIYDLILLIDVLEHFAFNDGKKLLELCLGRGRNLIISTPHDIGSQKVVFGNVHETHKFRWTTKNFFKVRLKEGFLNKSKCFVIPHKRALLVFIGEQINSVSKLEYHSL